MVECKVATEASSCPTGSVIITVTNINSPVEISHNSLLDCAYKSTKLKTISLKASQSSESVIVRSPMDEKMTSNYLIQIDFFDFCVCMSRDSDMVLTSSWWKSTARYYISTTVLVDIQSRIILMLNIRVIIYQWWLFIIDWNSSWVDRYKVRYQARMNDQFLTMSSGYSLLIEKELLSTYLFQFRF